MHHIPAELRPAALAEMFRVLRPGGRLLLADTHPFGVVSSAVIRVMARTSVRRTHDELDEHTDPLVAIDLHRYREVLRESGFSDLEFTTIAPSTGALLATKPAG